MLYTMKEVAGLFHVNKSTVCRWIQKGDIMVISHSGRLLVTEEELERFKKNNPRYGNPMDRLNRICELNSEKAELEERIKEIETELKDLMRIYKKRV